MTRLKRRFALSAVVLAAFVLAGTTGLWAEDNSSGQRGPATKISFGPVIERVLPTEGPDAQCFLDLDTGKLHTLPEKIAGDKDATDAWCLKNGIDLRRGKPVEGAGHFEMLDIKNLQMQMKAEWWEKSPQVVAGHVGRVRRHRRIVLPDNPTTMLFGTCEGGRGVLQIVGPGPAGRGVKIRFKMVEPPMAAGRPAKEGWGEEVFDLQFGIYVDRTSCRPGERIAVRYRLTSDIGGFCVSRTPASLALTISGPDGVQKQDWWAAYWAKREKPELPWAFYKGGAAYPILLPHLGHEEIVFNPLEVGHRVTFSKPGVYRLRATYAFDGVAVNARHTWLPTAWEGGSITSNEVTVTVTGTGLLTNAQRRLADELVADAMPSSPAWAMTGKELDESIAELAKREKSRKGWVAAEQVGRYVAQCRTLHVSVPAAIDEKVVDDIIYQYRNLAGKSEHELKERRKRCALALATIGHPKAVPVILEFIKEQSMIGAAWRALDCMADPRFLPLINEHLSANQHPNRSAVRCLGKYGHAAIPALSRIVNGPDRDARGNSLHDVKADAVDALVEICLPQCLAPLEKLARSEETMDKRMKQKLEVAIGTIRCRAVDRTYVPPKYPYQDACRLHHLADLAILIEAGRSEDPNLSNKAEVALLKIGPSVAAAALRPQLGSYAHGDGFPGPVFETSERAAELMVRIGEPAIPALLDALNDEYDHTRNYAASALKRITGEDFGTDYAQWRSWRLKRTVGRKKGEERSNVQ